MDLEIQGDLAQKATIMRYFGRQLATQRASAEIQYKAL